jgi:cobalamin biosynthesis Mg chelatase CobN
MQPKIISLSLSLLLAGALAVMAQSPTSSAPPGGSTTKDPYGATLDHPNPSSSTAASTATVQSTAPATTSTTTTTTSTDNTAAAPATPSSSMPTDTTGTSTDQNASAATASNTLPRTASNLPLIGALGLLALAGALTMRSAAKRA